MNFSKLKLMIEESFFKNVCSIWKRIIMLFKLTHCHWTRAIYESLDVYTQRHNDRQPLILWNNSRILIWIYCFWSWINEIYPCDYKCHTTCNVLMSNWPHMVPYSNPVRQLGTQQYSSVCSNVFPKNVSNLMRKETNKWLLLRKFN